MSEDFNSLEFDKNVNWDYITNRPENADKKFISINNEKGNIQRRIAKGWAVWDKEDAAFTDTWEPKKSAAKTSKDTGMVARIPVGRGASGEAVEQILMFKPLDQYMREEYAMHQRNANEQIQSVQEAAAAKGQSGMEGVSGVKGVKNVEVPGVVSDGFSSSFAPEPGSDVNTSNS